MLDAQEVVAVLDALWDLDIDCCLTLKESSISIKSPFFVIVIERERILFIPFVGHVRPLEVTVGPSL